MHDTVLHVLHRQFRNGDTHFHKGPRKRGLHLHLGVGASIGFEHMALANLGMESGRENCTLDMHACVYWNTFWRWETRTYEKWTCVDKAEGVLGHTRTGQVTGLLSLACFKSNESFRAVIIGLLGRQYGGFRD